LRLLRLRPQLSLAALTIPVTMIARAWTVFITITARNIAAASIILGTDFLARLLGVV
jgi:hypothetical protein